MIPISMCATNNSSPPSSSRQKRYYNPLNTTTSVLKIPLQLLHESGSILGSFATIREQKYMQVNTWNLAFESMRQRIVHYSISLAQMKPAKNQFLPLPLALCHNSLEKYALFYKNALFSHLIPWKLLIMMLLPSRSLTHYIHPQHMETIKSSFADSNFTCQEKLNSLRSKENGLQVTTNR